MSGRIMAGLLGLALAGLCAGGCDDDGGDTTGSGGTTGTGGSGTSSGTGGTTSSGGGEGGTTTSSGGGSGGQGGTTGQGGSGGSGSGTVITTSSCAGPTCDLNFWSDSFGAYEGLTLYLGIMQQGQPGLVWDTSTTITGGSFAISAPGVFQKGLPYNLNYWVDLDEDQSCDTSPPDDDDEVWRLAYGYVQWHLDVMVVPDEEFYSTLGCGGF